MDGDGQVNPLDDDADADGRRKPDPPKPAEPQEPDDDDDDCDPNDPDRDRNQCPDSSDPNKPDPNQPVDPDAPESPSDDRGPDDLRASGVYGSDPNDPAQPEDLLPADPTAEEREAALHDTANLFEMTESEADMTFQAIRDADPDATESERLDALVNQCETAIERHPPDDDGRDAVVNWPATAEAAAELSERVQMIRALAPAEADPMVAELTAATDQVFLRVSPDQRQIAIETGLAIAEVHQSPDVNDEVETALDLIAIAAQNGVPIGDMPESVPALEAAGRALTSDRDAIEAAFRISAEVYDALGRDDSPF
jgi:hypothetical protein